jgi:hypothetical protein
MIPNYKYRCWFQPEGPFSGKYRLQVFEVGKHTQYLYLQNWSFDKPEELVVFMQNYYPRIQSADWTSAKNFVDINRYMKNARKPVNMGEWEPN